VAISPVSVAPAKWRAVGYLPPDTDVIVGLHAAQIVSEPEFRRLFTGMLLNQTGFSNLTDLIGLDLNDINHAVVGLRVEGRVVPRLTLVLQTRRPYDGSKMLSDLRAHRPTERNGKTLYRFSPKQSNLELTLWQATERTLVAGIIPEDLDEVPAAPIPGAAGLGESSRRLLGQMPEASALWAIAHVAGWPWTFGSLPFLAGLPNTELALLAKLRSLALWLESGDPIIWHLRVECADKESAEEIENYLSAKGLAPGKPLPLLSDRPETEVIAQELSRTLTRRRENESLIFQAKSSLKK
jgi:hypothetical protein